MTHPSTLPTARNPRVAVLILNRNGRAWLSGLLDSLRSDGYPNKRVYLVDNASADDSVTFVRTHYPEVAVLRFPVNFGYCMAYNIAMQIAWRDGCEWTIWQNNDTLVLPGWLEEMLRVAATDDRIGVVGPAFYAWDCDQPNYYMHDFNWWAMPAMLRQDVTPVDVATVEGSCLMVHRRCVEDVGWLDPWLFFYFEETDFCYRAKYRGWRVVIAPRSLARHYAGGWSSTDSGNRAAANWLQIRNMLIGELARPNRSLWHNLLKFVQLGLIHQKESWLRYRSPSRAWLRAKAFFTVIAFLPRVCRKRLDARRGKHFAPLLPRYRELLEERPYELLPPANLDQLSERIECEF